MIIESSPTNLDPRVGIDAQSERIDNLIFDDLLSRGDDLNVAPGLAERWEVPDPLTYVFHLHRGVKFHDGRPLTSRDVKWTFDSLLQGKIRSTKAAVYRFVDRIDAPDDATVIFHMKEQDATLLWNLSDGAIGIVPDGSGDEMTRHPIGSGPFHFVSAETDRDVVIERNDDYWGGPAKLARVRFAVVPGRDHGSPRTAQRQRRHRHQLAYARHRITHWRAIPTLRSSGPREPGWHILDSICAIRF